MSMTWLDQYVRQMAVNHRAPSFKLPDGREFANPYLSELKGVTDLEVVAHFIEGTVANVQESYALAKAHEAVSGKDFVLSGLMQAEAVKDFVLPEQKRLLALSIDQDLLEDFAGAEPPETDYEAILSRYDTIYVDLPPGKLMFSEYLYLRAIVLYRDTRGHRRVFCPLPLLGQKVHLDFQIEIGWDWGVPVPPDHDPMIRPNDEHTGEPMEEGRRASEIREEVEALVKLALLYHHSGASPTVFLPHVDNARLRKLGSAKKQAAKQKSGSLFKVAVLKSPDDRFGRTDVERQTKGSYKLGVRTTVRGHFRWQAHGPKHSLRRLTWIAPFARGPKDGPDRPELHVLR